MTEDNHNLCMTLQNFRVLLVTSRVIKTGKRTAGKLFALSHIMQIFSFLGLGLHSASNLVRMFLLWLVMVWFCVCEKES